MQHRFPGFSSGTSLGQRAFTLVELAIVVLVLGVVVAGVVQMTNRYSAQRYDTQTAQEVKTVTGAVEAFLKNDIAEITKNDNWVHLPPPDNTIPSQCGFLHVPDVDTLANSPRLEWLVLSSTVHTVIRTDCTVPAGSVGGPANAIYVTDAIKAYLPANFKPNNDYWIFFKRGANIKTGVDQVGVPNITAAIFRKSSGGDNLTDTRLARIASLIGNYGGFVSPSDANTTAATLSATGAAGGWTTKLNILGVPDPTANDMKGAVVAMTNYGASNAIFNTNLLSRVPTGNSEANTMRTDLVMGKDTDIKGEKGNFDGTGVRIDDFSFLQAYGGVALSPTTAIQGEKCAFGGLNTPINTDPYVANGYNDAAPDDPLSIKDNTSPIKTGIRIYHNLLSSPTNGFNGSVVGGVMTYFPATKDVQTGQGQNQHNTYVKFSANTSFYELAGQAFRDDYTNPANPVFTTVGYMGRLVLGRASYTTYLLSLLTCQQDASNNWKWAPVIPVTTKTIGPVNGGANNAVNVVGADGVRSTNSYLAPYTSQNENNFTGTNDSRLLYVTLGTNRICGQPGINSSLPHNQRYCAVPEQLLGGKYCFWSNGSSGGDKTGLKNYDSDLAGLWNMEGNVGILGHLDLTGASSVPPQTQTNTTGHSNIEQQICPAGYYTAGIANNTTDGAPTFKYQGVTFNNCGDSGDDCIYMYCCPFDTTPSGIFSAPANAFAQ